MDETTTCPGCGVSTFVGDRIRHAPGCSVAATVAAEKRARMATVRPRRERALAMTTFTDPEIGAALRKDYHDNDK